MGLLMPLCSLGFLKAVNTALSCIRTVEAEHVPHLLRFLLLSATPTNVRRIISQIREQLKFVGAINSRAARNKKLKGKSPIDSTEASILDALRLSLLFKNVLIIYYITHIGSGVGHEVSSALETMMLFTSKICKHVGEFELLFLSDLEGGQFPVKYMSNGIEG
ncbi:hypothetical protein GW17_00026378 [Ensete ventricosum]|nr:hypothetical protein GW17_00026378 [Ensete ventricosum]